LPRRFEQPTVNVGKLGGRDDTVETHPCYASIGVSRVSGHAVLFNSGFPQNHYLTIRISAAERHRNLSNDWIFARKQYIEVALTESQWATFVSSPNTGSGVPCTLHYLQGEDIPQLPEPPNKNNEFRHELSKEMSDAKADIAALAQFVREAKMAKSTQSEIERRLTAIAAGISGSIQFVVDQFDEHIEKKVEEAKTEVNAYLQAVITNVGIDALKAGAEQAKLVGQTHTQG
jgi:hypothetical protein